MLKLPSKKILELENYYYMPKIIKNIISVLLVLQWGYEINGKRNSCSIFFNKFFYHDVINNDLLILSNDNIFYIDKSKKQKREELNNTLL